MRLLSAIKNYNLIRLGVKYSPRLLERSFSSNGDGGNISGCPFDDVQLPEKPTNCCMSGCANCVWIQYAEEVMAIFRKKGAERVREIVLSKIDDPNMRAYLELELRSLARREEKPCDP